MTVDRVIFLQRLSWLSEAAEKLRAIAGDELWQEIVETLGGSTVYIPCESGYYERRNHDIRIFSGNHTLKETSLRFCLSERQVKRILSSRCGS